MVTLALGIRVLLHGLVHVWYIVLSRGWVTFQPSMGWTGRSWLLTPWLGERGTGWLATLGYGAAALGLSVVGVGLVAGLPRAPAALPWAALLSAGVIIMFWDAKWDKVVQKGLVGLVLDTALVVVSFWF